MVEIVGRQGEDKLIMGVDITAIAQVKDNGKWKTVANNICDFRDYKFFHLIGGEYVKLIPPRGIPEDLSIEDIPEDDRIFFNSSGYIANLDDGWLTLEELCCLKAYAIQNNIDCMSNINKTIYRLLNLRNKYDVPYNDIRIVWVFTW